jgi:hypothetical protein
MFGKCKVCAAKDAELKSLKDEIAFLRMLVQPKALPHTKWDNVEANAILSGHQEAIMVEDDELSEAEQTERDKILSGNY